MKEAEAEAGGEESRMAQLSNIQVLTNGANIQQKVLTNGRAFQFSGISLVNYKRNSLTSLCFLVLPS